MKPLVLCLGSEIVSDDGFGPAVARRLAADPGLLACADVIAAAAAGFALLDLMAWRPRVLVVDVERTGAATPGRLRAFDAATLQPTRNLCGSHQVALPTALAFGRRLGRPMPSRVDVLACEALDLETLREELTPAVAAAVGPAVERVRQWVREPGPAAAPDPGAGARPQSQPAP